MLNIQKWLMICILTTLPLRQYCPAEISPADDTVRLLISKAGNAESDTARIRILKQLHAEPGIPPKTKADTEKMIAEIERWLTDKRLDYFSSAIRKKGYYDFQITQDSPLYPVAQFYQARMLTWVALEYGNIWSIPATRQENLKKVRVVFQQLEKQFPQNPLIKMYLGKPLSPDKVYPSEKNAPDWAVYQREALERLTDIIRWWIDNRMQDNGEYGGGWGDDCEMWRWWMPALVAFNDPYLTKTQARFSKALLDQGHMAKGYTNRMSDVEHTAEDAADAITPMMFLEADHQEWNSRALRLAELMRTIWTGTNERGFLQFKSTYFNSEQVNTDPRKACDTVFHPRVIQPALLYWQRSGDPGLQELITSWMDTWVDATARAERGKPAGIIPSAIHWPDGGIGGLGENWWTPGNYTDNPLYVWPSAMNMMTNTMLLTYYMTQNPKYLQPIRSMAEHRLRYLRNSAAEEPDPGTAGWCAERMTGIADVISKYRLLTGSTEFDTLILLDSSPYIKFRLSVDRTALTETLYRTARALRINFPGYTGEVRYTDRVLRFPQLFAIPAMYPEPLKDCFIPDTKLLFSSCTGEPGDGLYFPVNAVRWHTPPRNIAALVTETGENRFNAELFHFGPEPRPMSAELYLLKPGEYTFKLFTGENIMIENHQFSINGQKGLITFTLPPYKLCKLHVCLKK
ncbi:hypothetical protein JXQ31_17510 [candidate division KSB1 bacterium]|nr:hypothetical protein [candidate division KSB1 bacterium]